MMKDLARQEWLPILFRRLRYIYIFRCRILFATYRIGKFNDIGNIRKRTIPRLKICWIYIYIYLVSHNTGEFPSSVKRYSAKKREKKDIYQRYGLIESVSVEIRVSYNVEYEKGARFPFSRFLSSRRWPIKIAFTPREWRRMCNEGWW